MRPAPRSWFVLVVVLLLGTVAYAEKAKPTPTPKQAILGMWAMDIPNRTGSIEFRADGTFELKLGTRPDGAKVSGKYRWVDDTTMIIETIAKGQVQKDTLKIKLVGDTLAITDSKGIVENYKRGK